MKSLYLFVGLPTTLGLLAAGICPAAAQQAGAVATPPRDVVLRLDRIPDAYVKIGAPAGATIYRWPPEYGETPWAGATVYVRKDFEAPRTAGCENSNQVDEIDLSGIRRNGFHILEARLSPVTPPDGFTKHETRPGQAAVTFLDGQSEPAANMREAEKIRLSSVVWQKDQKGSAMVKCTSAYRLHVVLRGPGGKDPLVDL